MLNLNGNSTQPPKCGNPECTSGERAMVLLGDKFVCSVCIMNFQKNKNKIMVDMMNYPVKEVIK